MDYNKSINGLNYIITTDNQRMQVERVHRYLSEDSYWAKQIPFEVVFRAIENSLGFGVFEDHADGK